MKELEKFENSFIENPKLAMNDCLEMFAINERLNLKLINMDKHFLNSFYYKELSNIDNRIESKVFRFNMYNVFCALFKDSTINVFFNLSAEATLSGLFKAMIFLLNNSINKKYFPIKCTIIEFIIYEILSEKFTTNFKEGWLKIKDTVIKLFDEKDFDEYFKEKDKVLLNDQIKVTIH